MENHIKKLSSRILALYWKVIITNTLIISKTSYLSNVFPIDTETNAKTHKKIFQYIWNKKQGPTARKTTFLKKKLEGLHLIEPGVHHYAIKHLLTQTTTLEKSRNLLGNNRHQ